MGTDKLRERLIVGTGIAYAAAVYAFLIWFTWTGSPVAAYNMGTAYISHSQLCYPTTYPDKRSLPLACFDVNPHWMKAHGG